MKNKHEVAPFVPDDAFVSALEANEASTLEAVGDDFIAEWEARLEGLNTEELEALLEVMSILQTMTPAEKANLQRQLRRQSLTPEAARAAIVAELEAGREPAGELLGDWLAVDPALQAFFRKVFGTLVPPPHLYLEPVGFVVSA